MPQLVVVEGPNVGGTYEVQAQTTLGSDISNNIVLPDRRIAKKQAYFDQRDGAFYIRSTEDTRRILVNSQSVSESVLRHGDMLTIGETIMLFNEEASLRSQSVENDVISIQQSTIHSRKRQYEDTTHVIESFDQLDKSAKRLATLYSVANAISSRLDREDLLEKILDLIFHVFPADRGLILLREEGKRSLKPKVHRNKLSRSNEMPHVSRTIIKEVLRTKESVLTMDAMDDDRFLSGMSIVEQSIRSAMCVPLLSRDRLLGVISVDSSSRSEAFAEADLELMTGIAHQAANALENVRIYTRRKEHTEDLISLGKATQQLSSYLRKDTIYREAVHIACSLVKANRVSLACLDGHTPEHHIRLMFSRGIDPRDWKNITHPLKTDGLIGHAIMHNRSLLVRDPERDIPAEIKFEPAPQYATSSFIIIPISAKGDVFDFTTPAFGALCVTDKLSGRRFNERDLQLLSILASQIGIAMTNAELYERATVDSLTQTYVRRYFFQKLDELVERATSRSEPLILIMLDLDHFKQCNDVHGHTAGDLVLQGTGMILRKMIRQQDIAARYGGEEFGILLYDTGISTAVEIAERIRTSIEGHSFHGKSEPTIRMTVSIGLAELGPGDTPKTLIKKADDALYLAKENGRNNAIVFQP